MEAPKAAETYSSAVSHNFLEIIESSAETQENQNSPPSGDLALESDNIPPPAQTPLKPPLNPSGNHILDCDNSSFLANKPENIKLTLDIAEKWSVNQHLAFELVRFESGFNPKACNLENSTAKGMMQFLNSTWRNFCEGNVFNPHDNLNCGMKLLSEGGLNHWLADYRVKNHLVKVNAISE